MNIFYEKISLPKLVLDIDPLLEIKRAEKIRKYVCIITDTESVLNPEVTYIFKQLKTVPNFLIVFGHEANINHKVPLLIHTDVCKHHGQWTKVPFAINCEITDTPVTFNWFDVPLPDIYPSNIDTDDLGYTLVNGIHYGERYQPVVKVPNEVKLINSVTFKQNEPMLMNTSIPHAVEYSGYIDRLNVSLRFSLENFPSWNSAVERFRPIII